jgi:hypothetical protein
MFPHRQCNCGEFRILWRHFVHLRHAFLRSATASTVLSALCYRIDCVFCALLTHRDCHLAGGYVNDGDVSGVLAAQQHNDRYQFVLQIGGSTKSHDCP